MWARLSLSRAIATTLQNVSLLAMFRLYIYTWECKDVQALRWSFGKSSAKRIVYNIIREKINYDDWLTMCKGICVCWYEWHDSKGENRHEVQQFDDAYRKAHCLCVYAGWKLWHHIIQSKDNESDVDQYNALMLKENFKAVDMLKHKHTEGFLSYNCKSIYNVNRLLNTNDLDFRESAMDIIGNIYYIIIIKHFWNKLFDWKHWRDLKQQLNAICCRIDELSLIFPAESKYFYL